MALASPSLVLSYLPGLRLNSLDLLGSGLDLAKINFQHFLFATSEKRIWAFNPPNLPGMASKPS